jgi:hypothetical protein
LMEWGLSFLKTFEYGFLMTVNDWITPPESELSNFWVNNSPMSELSAAIRIIDSYVALWLVVVKLNCL